MRSRVVLKLLAAILLLGAAVTSAVAASFAGALVDPLWSKAVEITRASVDWVPGSASFVLQLVDEKGAAQDSWQSWYTLAPGTDGTVTVEVVKATHNGDDTTAREQENQRKSKQDPPTHWDNPFDPKVQSAVTMKPTGKSEPLAGRPCASYEFAFRKSDKSTLSGTAWIDAVTGAPVQVRYTASPLPPGLSSLTTTLRFAKGPAGEGFLQEALVEGAGGILFIKRSFRSVVSIGAYWLPASVRSPPASG
jgi:hypothetical protein